MPPAVIDIGWMQLGLGLLFIVIAGLASVLQALDLERKLLIGTARTFAQLFLLGYVLKFVFNLNNMWLVILIFVFMIYFASRTIYKSVDERQVSFFLPTFFSMLISFFFVSFVVTAIIVDVTPWWKPQYFIPLGGMVIGNSMNAVAVALERLLNELRNRRNEIEMMLCHGADYKEASREILRNAMRAGMIPSINSMMAVGIVFIPGMMTGQIIAGADPIAAIKYQIVVMVMLVGSTTIGTLLIILFVRRRCFSSGQQLLLSPRG